jgi:uncharacterized protein YjaG (DUF416 family)
VNLPSFDSDALRTSLDDLSPRQQALFGATCVERLTTYYSQFVEETGWGDASTIRRGVAAVWSYVGAQPAPKDLTELLAECEGGIPDLDEFEGEIALAAQNAMVGVCNLVSFVLRAEPGSIVWAARSVTDTVDSFVQDLEKLMPSDVDLEEKIRKHALMQQELGRQQRDLRRARLFAGDVDAHRASVHGEQALVLRLPVDSQS